MMLDSVTILVVDDEEMNREMLAAMLEETGTVLQAANGKEALEILAAGTEVDLVLLDLEMPVMDGYSTLDQLKTHLYWRDVPVIVATASRFEVARTLSLGANDFIAKPYNAEELRLRALNQIRTKKLSDLSKDLNMVLEREVARKTAALQKALDFSKETEYEITLRLGRATEFRDLETGLHTRRISEMADLLGKLSGLPEGECEILRYAAPLHDVGKVGIPDRILLKPGKLDPMEFDVMKRHTRIGGKILSESENYPVLEAGRIIALQHHEKWDGTGYPYGLKGEDIHLFGRIVMVVDVFDALSSERPYKPAFPLERSLQIMEEGRGTFFDRQLLQLFLDNIGMFVEIQEDLQDRGGEQHIADLFSSCVT